MFAIIRLGNQQFKVQAGDFIRSAFLKDSKEIIELPVLAIEDKSGLLLDPSELKNAKVKAQILREGLAKKVLVFKKKRRKGYRKTRGHRQKFTELQIIEIASGSSKTVASKLAKPTLTDSKAAASKKEEPKKTASKTVAPKLAKSTLTDSKAAVSKKEEPKKTIKEVTKK